MGRAAARRRIEPLADTSFHEAIVIAFHKIRASLPELAIDDLDTFADFFHQTVPGLACDSHKSEIVDSLLVALEESKAVHILPVRDGDRSELYRSLC